MENTVIVVPGLFGGTARKYYEPLAKMLGSEDFLVFRAGADWDPVEIAEEIRRIDGYKQVICLSCGALVGNILAGEANTEVYYICPYLGAKFINRSKKGYAYRMRGFFKGLATVLMAISWPFKRHRWYPLWGGTKPDGWFLSVYAICKQLKFALSEPSTICLVDGVVFSYGDTVVEPSEAARTSTNVVAAWRKDWAGPAHVNLRMEGEKFGGGASGSEKLGEDAKAYLAAFAEMLSQK